MSGIERDEAREELRELVEKYEKNRDQYTASDSSYNETQTRTEFIDPFLELLGWDVDNEKGAPPHLREVVHEASVEGDDEDDDEGQSRMPDYGMRLEDKSKFFIEAKKPSVNIIDGAGPAFQARRYGWTANHPMAVLTNFEHLVIYDCRHLPDPEDNPHVARLETYRFDEYLENFDEIWEKLSRQTVYTGQFDEVYDVDREIAGTEPFDSYFLEQIEGWREELADDLATHNPDLDQDQLNFLVQRLVNRIIFLRICEDRELEKYKQLQEIESYGELKDLFLEADERYNSCLFDFVEDELSLDVEVGSDVLVDIFKELYYPESPYAFAVVDAAVLGEIYELFLGKEVRLAGGGQIQVEDKPEVVESGGVVPTPDYIVDRIVEKTINAKCGDASPDDIAELRLADIACGSGNFLLTAYQELLNIHRQWYIENNPEDYPEKIYQGPNGEWRLSLKEKQRILLNNIHGVDIDIQAVEVTRFSLLLKVLENESEGSIKDHLDRHETKALPDLSDNIKCGNSLADPSGYLSYDPDAVDDEEQLKKVNPFDWEDGFPDIFAGGGFNVIVGNPPYIRIQNMVEYSPDEVRYYQSSDSPYKTAQSDNFDKYALFIERGLSLLSEDGLLGYIVPHKFTKIKSGEAVRELISSGDHLRYYVDFGVEQVFGNRSTTYTCILVLTGSSASEFTVEWVPDLKEWKYSEEGPTQTYDADEIDADPWVFVPPSVGELFDRIEDENPSTLGDVANIFVGLQTSADDIYIVDPRDEDDEFVYFEDQDGRDRKIERGIVRPCLHDVELQSFGQPRANAYMIFPYEVDDGSADLYDQDQMERDFPECWDYLNDYKDELEDRSVQGYTPETWYRYGRSQSLTKFDGRAKLIWPVLSLEPRYTYDDNNVLFTGGGNGPYYTLRPEEESDLSIFYLQAVLSHPVFEAMVRSRASMFRGAYYSHGKQFIEHLPIKKIDDDDESEVELYEDIVDTTKKLIDATEKWKQATTPQKTEQFRRLRDELRSQLNRKVGRLYDIDESDIEVLEELSREIREAEEE